MDYQSVAMYRRRRRRKPVAQNSDGPRTRSSRATPTDSTLSDARVARALNEGLRSLDPADQKNLDALVLEIFGNDRVDETDWSEGSDIEEDDIEDMDVDVDSEADEDADYIPLVPDLAAELLGPVS